MTMGSNGRNRVSNLLTVLLILLYLLLIATVVMTGGEAQAMGDKAQPAGDRPLLVYWGERVLACRNLALPEDDDGDLLVLEDCVADELAFGVGVITHPTNILVVLAPASP